MFEKRGDFKLYRCFSNTQKLWLMEKGFRFEMIAKDPNTDVLFWIFMRSPEFNKALDEYSPHMKIGE